MPFTTQTLKEYFKEIGWTENNYYSNLNSWSRDLIYFSIPSTLSISLGKNITQNLKSAYTLNSTGDNSFAFISSSETIEAKALELHHPNAAIKEPLTHWNPSTFLYGRLHRDGRLEALSCRTLKQNVMVVASGLSTWKKDPAFNVALRTDLV
jgi:Mitochondrial distribution and morphology protein 10